MLIAIDFDSTYTIDPEFWNSFILMSKSHDHQIICVTMRYSEEKWFIEESIGKLCKIYYTGRKAKKLFINNLGLNPDVWIDDSPQYVNKDHEEIKMWTTPNG